MAHSLHAVARGDRWFVVGTLGVMVALGWGYMAYQAGAMHDSMHHAAGHVMPPWNAQTYLIALLMWCVMMVAMMLPAAAPMILTFARVRRQRQAASHPAVPTAVFVAGYLTIWSVFSVAAAAAQWALHDRALLSMMDEAVPLLAAGLLLVAGAFQWTKLKDACLEKCRTPLTFLATEWREGPWGAFLMGARHGLFCMGCCWALMLLMFVGGVMNLLWMAGLAAYMLAEKMLPGGQTLSRAAGVFLIAAGFGVLASSLVA